MQPPVVVPLIALGFANLPLLAGLGAASIPIILHLLNKRRFREERWAAMRFLLAAIRKNQRRIRVEQWLLLAVRTLLIVCVVAAMAKPFLERYVPILIGQRTHRVLVLDGSLSMATKAGAADRFAQAEELAERLVKDARKGDALSLVLMADPPRVVIGAPSPNHDEVLKELSETTLTHGATDLTASIEAIDRVLAASDIGQKEVVVLTDLQRASWRKGGDPDPALRRALAKLAGRRTRSVIIDLGAAAAGNRAITALKLNQPIVTAGMSPPPLVTATVRNFGPGAADNLKVRLVVDGSLGPEESLSLQAGEERVVLFNQDFTTPGEHLIEARIGDDALPLDNRRWLSVPVRESVRVLLVDGDPRPGPFKSETSYLAAALEPDPEADSAGAPAPIRAEVAPESGLAQRNLATFDVVAVCNVARFSAAEVAALDAFLKQGGGLILFAGDQVRPDAYNAELFRAGEGLLPAEIGPPVGDLDAQAGKFEFNPLGFKHPIISEFTGQAAPVVASLTNVKTSRFFKLKLPKNSPAQVALAFDNGDPAVIEAPRYRGRVIQVATTADAGWTTWPLHPSFPAVMQQMVLEAASGRLAERNVRVGQPLDQALPPAGAEAIATVTRPDRKVVTSKLAADGDVSRLHYEDTDLSGSYAVRVAPPVNLQATYAANPDPAESDPARLDRRELADALPGWDFDYRSDLGSLLRDAASVSQRGELHRPFLWAALALLFVESILAWRFGHHTPA